MPIVLAAPEWIGEGRTLVDDERARTRELGGRRRCAGQELERISRGPAVGDVGVELGALNVEIPPIAQMHAGVQVDALEMVLVRLERERPAEAFRRVLEAPQPEQRGATVEVRLSVAWIDFDGAVEARECVLGALELGQGDAPVEEGVGMV